MKALAKRLAALEGFSRAGWKKIHRVIQEIGQSRDEAVAAAGIVVGPNDLLIVQKLVAPKHDADGNLVSQFPKRERIEQ